MKAACPALLLKPATRTLVCTWLLTFPALPLQAGVTEPSELTQGHVFFVEEEEQLRPIVGVESTDKVIIQLDNQERKTVRTSGAAFLLRDLPPAGRVTVLGTAGRTGSDTTVGSNFISTFSRTTVEIDLVFDTSLEEVYAALILMPPEGEGQEVVTFCPIGDVEAGKVEHKYLFFPNVDLDRGWRYRFEFYCNGYPLEMFRMDHVAEIPGSQGLRIPWEQRIRYYLHAAREKERSGLPKAFDIGFHNLDQKACRERGVEDIKLKLKIRQDGRAEILATDEALSEEEVERLKQDAASWCFFPALKEGKPFDVVVNIPLRL